MRRYARGVVCGLYLMLTGVCSATGSKSVPLDCSALKVAVAGVQRLEVPAAGFSVLPPQGENWCVQSLAFQGITFYKHPGSVEVLGDSPSEDEIFQETLKVVRFMGMAMSLPEFGAQSESPDQLRAVVDELIKNHLFSQIIGGISSAKRRFGLVESHFSAETSFGASCVRFGAKVEAQGFHLAPPGVVFILNFSNNLVCAHPQQPPSSKSSLIWIGFVEIYRQGDQPAVDAVNREVEPFLKSLQFTAPSK